MLSKPQFRLPTQRAALLLSTVAASCFASAQAQTPNETDAQQAALKLPPVQVNSTAEVKDGTAESGYRSKNARLGPLGDTALKDVPFSINVTPGALIENLNLHTATDALATNPTVAVMMEAGGINSGMSRIMIRGYSASDANEYRDGLVDRSWAYVPIENVERIEVLNGLTGFFNGGLDLRGGTVNYVSKQPTSAPLAVVRVGQYDGGLNFVHFDLGGPFDSSERLAYRLNAYKEHGSTYVEGGSQDRSLLSGVLSYRLFADTVLKTDFYRQTIRMDGTQAYIPLLTTGAVPSADLFSARTQYGQSWTFSEAEKTLLGVSAETRLSSFLKFRTAYRMGEMSRSYDYVKLSNLTASGTYKEKNSYTPAQYEDTHASYALFDSEFDTGPLQHALTFGYNGYSYMYNNARKTLTYSFSGTSSIYAPVVYAMPTLSPLTISGTPYTEYQDNVLIGDRITLNDRWSALVGLTHTRVTDDARDLNGNALSTEVSGEKNTPSYALMFKPSSDVTTYVSYIQGLQSGGSYGEPTYTDDNGVEHPVANWNQVLPPAASTQWEAGVKATLGNVDLSAALFRIQQVNTYLDLTDYVYKQDGQETHQGLEFTASGKLTPSLTLVGGFTLLRARVDESQDSPIENGRVPVNVPERLAKAYLEYRLPGVDGLTAGFGARYVGPRPVDIDNATQTFLSGATVYNAALRYETAFGRHKTTLNLTIDNLFDKRYWSYYRSGDGLLLGKPRVVAITASLAY